jgi:hypothetical protein
MDYIYTYIFEKSIRAKEANLTYILQNIKDKKLSQKELRDILLDIYRDPLDFNTTILKLYNKIAKEIYKSGVVLSKNDIEYINERVNYIRKNRPVLKSGFMIHIGANNINATIELFDTLENLYIKYLQKYNKFSTISSLFAGKIQGKNKMKPDDIARIYKTLYFGHKKSKKIQKT